jgi:hypothetical protein
MNRITIRSFSSRFLEIIKNQLNYKDHSVKLNEDYIIRSLEIKKKTIYRIRLRITNQVSKFNNSYYRINEHERLK